MYPKEKWPREKGSFVFLTDNYLFISNLATEQASLLLVYTYNPVWKCYGEGMGV